MTITAEQQAQLLRPLNKSRVAVLDGNSHLAAWDVRAHLIRVFGFGQWSADLIDLHMLYDQETQTRAGKEARKIAYRATVRLLIHATGATYTEAAVGESIMPTFKHGDAHDMAIKTAESQAFKRCAINLGTQFGLSLYDAGTLNDVVKGVLGANSPVQEPDRPVTPDDPEVLWGSAGGQP
jgi:recombination DNA repair RAD52 pathway protein